MFSLPSLPGSWSQLSWQQLCECWVVKQRYGGNADVARCTALLTLLMGSGFKVLSSGVNERTGEQQYLLIPQTYNPKFQTPKAFAVTPRELAWMASQALPWFDFPYGDKGEDPVKDEKGKVVKEGREAHVGYVGPMRDAMAIPEETVKIGRRRFALPQVAMNNLTWQQYRSLQAIAPRLFREGIDEKTALNLQAQFLAHILVPRSLALLDSNGRTVKFRPHWVYEYDAERADQMVGWWEKRLSASNLSLSGAIVLFHIMFQVYQTSLSYYSAAYPLLFQGGEKIDPLKDALTGEVGTVNVIMKYAGYAEQQQVYDSNVPFVLDILNTMTKEAKEIEKINNRVKRKK